VISTAVETATAAPGRMLLHQQEQKELNETHNLSGALID
jgi:hypothetical protein